MREYRITFEISGDVPNAETVEAIKEVKRMKANPSLGKTYSNVDQMMDLMKKVITILLIILVLAAGVGFGVYNHKSNETKFNDDYICLLYTSRCV